MQTFLILADQFAHIFAAGSIAALADLLVDEGFQAFRKRDIHSAHALRLGRLANFGKDGGPHGAGRFVLPTDASAPRHKQLKPLIFSDSPHIPRAVPIDQPL